jgi:glycosyltransferase involved in cell wall biosynthesis
MNLLFLHQNAPGQFGALIAALAAAGHRVAVIGARPGLALPGVGCIAYTPEATVPAGHPFLRPAEAAIRRGRQVAGICAGLARNGFTPDVVVAHPGWGESLFVKEVWPATKLLHYCEFYYNAHGADVNFDPAQQQGLDGDCATRARNAHLLLALAAEDAGWSPTEWQRAQFPAAFRADIAVIPDGVDTDLFRPDPAARFATPNGTVLAPGDEVVTYVARNLEPYRGFPSFMRALPAILRARPAAHVVVLGGDATSYGKPPADGRTWRQVLTDEIGGVPARVHFLGRIARADYRTLLQVSAAHVYLTVPFVLSWSMLEAMAAGCLVVGSATPPVQEMIVDGENGVLVDFFDPAGLAERVVAALADAKRPRPMRAAARRTVVARYGRAEALARQIAAISALAAAARA